MATFQDGFKQQDKGFVDRRSNGDSESPGVERRQFGNSHLGLSPDARELAEAIDNYKIKNRRRYVTFEEMLQVMHSLGYEKQDATTPAGLSNF